MPTLTVEYRADAERLEFERAISFVMEMRRLGASAASGTVDDETIRRITHATAKEASTERPQRKDAEQFAQASGEIEVPINANKVNTLEGWRDVKIALFSKREAGEAATPAQRDERELPAPTLRTVIAAGILSLETAVFNAPEICYENTVFNGFENLRGTGNVNG